MAGRAIVVGAGFGGLASASLLARDGWQVTVLEKNDQPGGRARYWRADGFTFDMGPSWYLMPEAFERVFGLVGEKRSDYYGLARLDPSYRVYFESSPPVEIGADLEGTVGVFDRLEPGAGARLKQYLELTSYKYRVAVEQFLYRDYRGLFDFFNRRLLTEGMKLQVFRSLDAYLRDHFFDHRTRKILEFPMVFLGASPTSAPALYSIMSHLDMNQGVWYPDGGMAGAALGFHRLAEKMGVEFVFGRDVRRIDVEAGAARSVATAGETFDADVVVVNGDYPHAETGLLEPRWQTYRPSYWSRRVLGPSMLVAYVGVRGRVEEIRHHTLYFTDDWNEHFDAIFSRPAWPARPSYYVCCTSKTDPFSAPPDHENLFFLVPLAAGLEDSDSVRESYFDGVLDHFERLTGQTIRDRIVVRRLYSGRDFAADYHAYRGAALGIAHTLLQTAVFRPSLRSRRVGNLYYAGQYTHPGVGVPMTLIAAELVSARIAEEQR